MGNLEKLFLFFHTPTTPHAEETEEDEGNTEELPHVEEHAVLEIYLIFLGVLDEDASSEDEEEAETEEEACTYLLGLTTIEVPMYAKEEGIAESLIELTWMAWQHINTLKDEGPRYIGNLANDFGIHEVAQTDSTSTDGSDDSNVVEHRQKFDTRMADIEI